MDISFGSIYSYASSDFIIGARLRGKREFVLSARSTAHLFYYVFPHTWVNCRKCWTRREAEAAGGGIRSAGSISRPDISLWHFGMQVFLGKACAQVCVVSTRSHLLTLGVYKLIGWSGSGSEILALRFWPGEVQLVTVCLIIIMAYFCCRLMLILLPSFLIYCCNDLPVCYSPHNIHFSWDSSKIRTPILSTFPLRYTSKAWYIVNYININDSELFHCIVEMQRK